MVRAWILAAATTLLPGEPLAVRVAPGGWGDAGTADFLTGLMEEHEKMAWMLRSMLE